MDRQVISRIIVFAAVLTMVLLAATSSVSPTLVLAIAVPAGFVAAAIFLLGVPFAAVQKADGKRLGWKRLLDAAEHAGPLAWIDMMTLWSTSGVAFMGLDSSPMFYKVAFGVALVAGLIAALTDLFLSEAGDKEQQAWQQHPE